MPTYENLTQNSPDGTQIGSSATEKLGFFGATPAAQPDVTQQTTATTTALRADLDSLINALDTLGIVDKQ
jgi:hypothetical protein